MARLLMVTDNTFYRQTEGIYDNLCYDRAFFEDYAAVFNEVRVAARVRKVASVEGLLRADGGPVSFVELADANGAAWALASRARYCRPLADAIAWADAVCARLPSVSGWHAARIAHRLGKPFMFELIGDPFRIGYGSLQHLLGGVIAARRTRWIVRRCQVGSYVSRAHLQRRYRPAPGATTASISSIRLPPAAFRAARAAPAAPAGLRLVLVAELMPYKNHKTLLDAVALVAQRQPEVSLTLVGDGPLRPALERQCARQGIAGRVRFTGMLTGRAKVEAELDAADLFVIPSWSEGMPRAAIEAMARGLPVIGSRVGGIPELLPGDLLFDPGRPRQIARLIEELREPARYRAAAQACTQTAVDFAQERLSAARRKLLAALLELASRVPHSTARPAGTIEVIPQLSGPSA